ncbi:MAG: hypothetical protein KDE31_32750, partial [Caldilineaceae bacterium]|nr:hypothetical protein [Caldilineaceae bacterium]
LGSASLELDDLAQIISYEEYAPYGSTTYQAVRSQTETPKRYRYTGMERDEESGLYYHGARYYAAWLGRWQSSDPENLVDGPNLYQYTISNPIRHSDPTGTQHLEQGTVDDPVVMGCVGGECYMNIRQSRFQELQRQARAQQQGDTDAAIASNPFSAIFWEIARLFTDDPNKQATAAQLGVATFGVVGAAAGVAQGRQQMRSVAPAQPRRPVATDVRPATASQSGAANRSVPSTAPRSPLAAASAPAAAAQPTAAVPPPSPVPTAQPAPAAGSPAGWRESTGASPRGGQFQSASAQTPRSLITAVRADVAESQAYMEALQRGEIGLQRPGGSNVPGTDFITARIRPNGGVEVLVTDVKASTIGRFPSPRTTVPPVWLAEVQAAVAPGRLNLNDPTLEGQIRAAVQPGRVLPRQVNVNYAPTPQGQGRMTGF